MEKFQVTLKLKDGRDVKAEVTGDYVKIGVILRQDTRMDPPVRFFVWCYDNVYVETDGTYVNLAC